MVEHFGSARAEREMVEALLDEVPRSARAALHGDREALVRLLLLAGDAGWEARAGRAGSVTAAAKRMHHFVDAIADCYSEDRPPAAELCDSGFELAARVEALAAELTARRAAAGLDDQPAASPDPVLIELRHLARAHLAALRDAVAAGLMVGPADVEAAAGLYDAVVAAGRQAASRRAHRSPTEPPAG